jgi:transcriptional regulator with XRE-family HTH domain
MTDKQYLIALGKRIVQQRKKIGWTQEELAVKSEMDRTALVRVEAGTVNSGIINLKKLAKALEISIGELVDL